MKKHVFVTILIVMLAWASRGYSSVDVFVSIPPQKWLVEAVGKDLVNINILVKEGQNPHTFEPSPRQMAALVQAKIWFIMDMEFEAQLVQKVRAVAPGLQIVDITRRVAKISMMESDAQHEGEGHEQSAEHSHAEAGRDPHVWLSPLNLQVMSQAVAEALAGIDPVNAAAYTAHQATVQQELADLHQQISGRLKPYSGSSFYVFHPSFGYFANAYGLKQESVEAGGKSPSPRQLATLIAKAKAEQVQVIFVQPQFDPKSAQAIASAIGGNVVPLDALAENVTANLLTMAAKIEAALAQ